MQNRRKLNVAMIGYGFMGRAHSNAFHQAARFFDLPFTLRLKTICGRNQEKLTQMAGDWGWEEIATEWEKVVERPDIDIVDICTPNYLHEPIAVAAARAGKMVFCEKPLANTVHQAENMTRAARNVPTLVWFNYRRVPAVAFARRLVEDGRLGNIFHYRALYLQSWGTNPADPAAWRFNPNEAGSGVAGDLLSHSLDLATWLNGPIQRLCSRMHTFAEGRRVDDAVDMLVEFRNGSIGMFEASRFATGNQNRNCFEINGASGSIEFNLEEMNYLHFDDLRVDPQEHGPRKILVTGQEHPYVGHFWPPGHIIGYEHTFIATLADFLFALGRNERFRPDFADALGVQHLLEAVAESNVKRCWIQIGPQESQSATVGT
jgi:predicted dehydrogenase